MYVYITKSILFQIRWELRGLDTALDPSQFSLGVKGSLYSDSQGPQSRLKGQLEMNISFVLPPVLALIPEDVRRNVAESVTSPNPFNINKTISIYNEY